MNHLPNGDDIFAHGVDQRRKQRSALRLPNAKQVWVKRSGAAATPSLAH
jgi:hypothetical protein